MLLSCILIFTMASCANSFAGSQNTSSAENNISSAAGTGTAASNASAGSSGGTASLAITLNPVSSNVCFREGTEKDGHVAVPTKDIAGFYALQSRENHTMQIVFQLTEKGKKSMAESTERLSKSAGSMSLWVGKTKLLSAEVRAPITDGSVAFTEPDSEKAKKDCIMLSLGHPEDVRSGK